MQQEAVKTIIDDMQVYLSIIHRLKSRLPNLDVEPSKQLIINANNTVNKIEKTMRDNICVLSEMINYVRLDEVLNADQSLRNIGIGRLGQALRRTGIVSVTESDIRHAFISRQWDMIESAEDDTYIYGEDDFHVFTIVFALAYKKAKNFNESRQKN